jgi:hypothetical protein
MSIIVVVDDDQMKEDAMRGVRSFLGYDEKLI